MREILFKAKRLDNGECVDGFYCCIGPAGQEKHYIIPMYASAFYGIEVDPSTVCEWTGLTDKNGKKIFEGDKLYDPHENVIYTVGWNEERAMFQMEYSWHRKSIESTNYCEIIGSIHDGEGDDDD